MRSERPTLKGKPMPAQRLLPYKWELMVLLWFAYCFNQADRQVYNVVLPALQNELHINDVQAGLVASVFMWTYAMLVPVAGYAGDVFRRKWIVFWSLTTWSMATMVSGATTGLAGLVFFRSLATGGGEAFYYPAANSLIGQYHEKTRALAMSIHQTSAYVGIVGSGLMAGWIADRFGWRMSFYAFGGIGVVLAMIILFRLQDVKLPTSDQDSLQAGRLPIRVVLKAVGRKPTFWALCAAFCGFNFVGWGFFTWMPTLLHDKFGLSLAEAGFSSTFYSNICAMLTVLAAGRLSDALAMRRRSVRIEFEYVSLFAGAPFIVLMSLSDSLWLSYLGLAAFGVCRGLYDSNLFAALFEIVEPRFRASAVGFMLAMSFLVSAFAPVTLGWAKMNIGLAEGMAALSLIFVISAIILLIAAKWFLARDYSTAD